MSGKTLLQQNFALVNSRCLPMQVDLCSGHKIVVIVVCLLSDFVGSITCND